jgi:transposase-like protein
LPLDVRIRAQELCDQGFGYHVVARQLSINLSTSRRWRDSARQGTLLGSGVMGNKRYPFEVKVAAVERFLSGASTTEVVLEYEISTRALLNKWVAIYRDDGPDGLRPGRRGRPARNPSKETLEQKVQRLEMENAALKKLQALVAADQRRTGKKPR